MINAEQHTHRAACHCGAVVLRVRLVDGLASSRRCNCSYCRMRGAIAVSVRVDDLFIEQGAQNLTLYQFNTRSAQHWFCRTCGIYTHHRRRSEPSLFGVNLACLDGLSPFDLPEVPVMEGGAHPSDSGQVRVAGVLRYHALP